MVKIHLSRLLGEKTDLLEYIPNERKTTGKYLILEEHGNRKQKKEKD